MHQAQHVWQGTEVSAEGATIVQCLSGACCYKHRKPCATWQSVHVCVPAA